MKSPRAKSLIFFVGFMASGKSRIGKLLAENLGLPFVDTDSLIEEKTGTSIAEIFERQGEGAFRRMERDVLEELIEAYNRAGAVVATGGGLPCGPGNIELMKEHGAVIYLKAGIEDIIRRIGKSEGRPVFESLRNEGDLRANIKRLFKAREPFYLQADFVARNSGRETPERLVRRINRSMSKFMKMPGND